MSLTDWAAIAEIVGAVAVVVTLLYLAIQVKQSKDALDANTKAVRGQVVAETMHSEIAYLSMFTHGHDVADTYIRFTNDEELDPRTMLVADAALSAMFLARQHEFFQWKHGLLDEKIFAGKHHVTLTVLGSNNGRLWWENEGRKFCSTEFVDYIEDLSRTSTTDDLESWRRAIKLSDSAR